MYTGRNMIAPGVMTDGYRTNRRLANVPDAKPRLCKNQSVFPPEDRYLPAFLALPSRAASDWPDGDPPFYLPHSTPLPIGRQCRLGGGAVDRRERSNAGLAALPWRRGLGVVSGASLERSKRAARLFLLYDKGEDAPGVLGKSQAGKENEGREHACVCVVRRGCC